jgi:NitT/TauT family transport system ATP-binding protein
MSVLSFRDVWVEYGEKIILEKVTLDVAEGAFVSIVGPSGAGKSTFLRLVLGQEAPSRGRIHLDGEPLRPEPGPDRGVVFQRYSVFPHMTVLKNVMFGVQCNGRKSSARDEAAEMLRQVGLGDNLDVYPSALSGGMQQRLAA